MRTTTNRRTPVLLLVPALLAAASVVVGAQYAASKTTLAAPVITSSPAANAASTAATFAFSGPNGATSTCTLDGAAMAACTSPKSYTGLAQGSHTFGVQAVQGASQSAVTSYAWTVDTVAPPAPTMTNKPVNPSATASPSFAFTDADATATFRCALDGAAYIACSSPKAYSGLTQGAHTLAVQAVDPAGNIGPATTYGWTVDTMAPTAPVLTQKPSDPTSNATNTVAWTAGETGLTFQCALENGAWFTCTSPYTWVIDTGNYGQHQIGVRGIDAAGNPSAATYYSFKYQKGLSTSGVPFTISGSVTGLTLGLWRPVAVTLTNPNPVTIYVTALSVTVAANSTPTGCPSATNVELQQSNVSATQVVVVPANGSLVLPAQGATNPQIRLKNLPTVNQDVCKGKSFALTYSGTANN